MQINARDWRFEVSIAPGEVVPVWAAIAGTESFTISNSEGEESTETTTFASNGQAESQAMQRGASLSIEGKIVRAATTPFAQDAGQVACDTLAGLLGEESLGGIRFRYVEDEDWTVWTAWASKGDNGGGNNDKTSWSVSFTRSGAATTDSVA
jgi:hypothetical protein